jgi:hypothetical protein
VATKNNPGKFDCYEKAEPDEPMFTLLARDPMAAKVVRYWIELRKQAAYNPGLVTEHTVIAEARACADAMEDWLRRERPDKARKFLPTPPPQAAEPPEALCCGNSQRACPCVNCPIAPPAAPAVEPPRVMSIDRHGDPVAVDPFLPPAVPAMPGTGDAVRQQLGWGPLPEHQRRQSLGHNLSLPPAVPAAEVPKLTDDERRMAREMLSDIAEHMRKGHR